MPSLNPTPLKTALAGIASALLSLSAHAHYLWIERAEQSATVYFGEFEESARERSPGRLDEMPLPRARVLAATAPEQSIPLQKRAQGFAFPAVSPSSQALIVEEGTIGVKDWSKAGIGIVKPFFYARHQRLDVGNLPPALPLDILPTTSAETFQVFFQGQPLAHAQVKIVAPNTWAQEGRTQADGRVKLPMPWAGQYILQVIHMEKPAGVHEGRTYQAKRHRATLTVVNPGASANTAASTANTKGQ